MFLCGVVRRSQEISVWEEYSARKDVGALTRCVLDSGISHGMLGVESFVAQWA